MHGRWRHSTHSLCFCFCFTVGFCCCRCSRLLSFQVKAIHSSTLSFRPCSWVSIVYILTDGGASTWVPFPSLFVFRLGNKEKDGRRRPFAFPSVHTHSVHTQRRLSACLGRDCSRWLRPQTHTHTNAAHKFTLHGTACTHSLSQSHLSLYLSIPIPIHA